MNPKSEPLIDPTAETSPTVRARRAPPPTLAGKTVALLDIGKTRSDEFLDHLQRYLAEHDVKTARYAKPTNAKIAPTAVLQAIATEADLVVSALAD